jgi:hypothetical protein
MYRVRRVRARAEEVDGGMTLEQVLAAAAEGERFLVEGNGGVAWRCAGAEERPDEDTHWSGYEVPTGRVLLVMVGDNAAYGFDPEDVSVLDELDYCHVCGQLGCGHDGLDRG